MANDLHQRSPKELAELGIYSLIERRFDRENPYWVIPNQKILVVDPGFLGDQGPGSKPAAEDQPSSRSRSGSTSDEVIPRPPALENSITNFFQSLFTLLTSWLSWIIGSKKGKKALPPPRPVVRKDSFEWYFDDIKKTNAQFAIVRVGNCPNDEAEYGKPGVSILVEWDQKKYGTQLGPIASFEGLQNQAENHFIINPDEHNDPGWPEASKGDIKKTYPSDFMVFDRDDTEFYTKIDKEHAEAPIVAVMDTGLGYKWQHKGQIERYYRGSDGSKKYFLLAKANHSLPCATGADFGYCGIADYFKKPAFSPILDVLNPLGPDDIRRSSYDDNLVDQEGAGGTIKTKVGRHGTLITAILNREGCRVLPVKAFNGSGMGTLFDVLDCCNYIIACKRSGTAIKVLNASFSGSLNKAGEAILRRKITAMTEKHGIWVVAAAGNEDRNLDGTSIYPAQFGLPVASGGIEKVITVNSKYADSTGQVGNTGQAVSMTAVSPANGGFPSAIRTNFPNPPFPVQGTSFAAPYVAGALAGLSLTGLSRDAALASLAVLPPLPVAGVTFVDNS